MDTMSENRRHVVKVQILGRTNINLSFVLDDKFSAPLK